MELLGDEQLERTSERREACISKEKNKSKTIDKIKNDERTSRKLLTQRAYSETNLEHRSVLLGFD